jgi:hypothetical protein
MGLVAGLALLALAALGADDPPKPATADKPKLTLESVPPAATPAAQVDLAGKTNTEGGEARRNENVQVSLIDTNAQKEMNARLGASATVIEEFRPDRSYFGAEYGGRVPVPLHVAPAKAAGFHGTLHWTHMNSVLRARSFFQVGPVQPARENGYGANSGFRPWRSGYLSLDASQQKIRGMVNGNVLIPRPDERTPLTRDPRTGELSPAGRDPAAYALIQRFLDAFPLVTPNRTDIAERALNRNAPQSIDTDSTSARLDQEASRRDRLVAQHTFTTQHIAAYQFVRGQNPDTTTRNHTARLSWVRTWNPRTLLNVSAGFDRVSTVLAVPAGSVGPTVDFSNALQTLGPPSSVPLDRAINRFRFAAELRKTQGNHVWTLGAAVARRQFNSMEFSGHRFIYYFRNDFGRDQITNFRMGAVSRYSGSLGDRNFDFRYVDQEYYAGDAWRLHPRLTLTFGLRYEPYVPPEERLHRVRIPLAWDCNNLAPRFGFAWRVPGRGGVVRAAYGLHHADLMPVTVQQLRFNPPVNVKVEVQSPPDPVRPLATLKPEDLSPEGRSIFVFLEPGLRVPYSHQYNFSWEPSVGRWRLSLGYVGSRTLKLPVSWFTNRALPAADPSRQITATINERRPDPRYYDFRRVINASIAYYDAARITLFAPRWANLTFDVSYWFSKAIDQGASYVTTATGEDARQGQSQTQDLVQGDLKGLSSFDQPHALLAHASYRTPGLDHAPRWLRAAFGAWNVNGIYLAKTGTPFTVISGSDGPGFGNVDGAPGDRVNILDPRLLGRTIGHPDTAPLLMPRAAFAFMRPTDARGNIGVNTFRKGGIFNLNFALGRDFRVWGERLVAFRAEAINLLNTPQFADPGRELASPNFGQITNTLNDGRTIQFGLRFRW